MTRLARSMDSACNSMQLVCTGLLEKTVEALLFRLGELKGLACWFVFSSESIPTYINVVNNIYPLDWMRRF